MLRIISLLFIVALLLVNCNRANQKSTTDYDQLYALWHDDQYRDSLMEKLKPSVENALQWGNTKEKRDKIDSLLSKLRWTRDSISFLGLSRKAIDFSKNALDDDLLANTYNNMGMYYHDKGILDSTYYYYVKAENIYKKLGDSLKVGEMEFFQARLLYEQGLIMESEVKVSNSLKILQKYPLSPTPFEANQLMGLCLAERGEYAKAKEYLLKGLELMLEDWGKNKKLDSTYLSYALAMVYNNLSALELLLEDYQKASLYAQEGLKYIHKKNPPLIFGFLNTNRVRAEFLMKYKAKNFKIEPYISVVEQAYVQAKKVGNSYFVYDLAMMIADMYSQVNNKEKALFWGKQAYLLALDKNLKVLKRDSLEFILSLEDFKDKEQVKEAIELNHVLAKEDNTTRNRFARIAYETEKVILENDQLKNTLSILLFSGILLITISGLVIYVIRLKMKNKEIKLINKQQQANEYIYQLVLEKSEVISSTQNRIAKDLHDGVVNNIFTIRFNLQKMKTEEIELQNDLIKELQSLEKNTRDITHLLYQENLLKNNTLISLISDLVSLQKNEWNTLFHFEFDKSMDIDRISTLDKVNIYFIIREAIHNVNKHSKATNCTIILKSEERGISIRIVDNGIGFDPKLKRSGIGLSSMKERVTSLKSKLVINSNVNAGTELFFKVE
ncbi:MAG: ATP-binding protein [Flavobacteriaceae bacterium]|jgi:signal transduction histidine kinase|nr:ATP-binding protein [Flavobacteriaceae bacterium]